MSTGTKMHSNNNGLFSESPVSSGEVTGQNVFTEDEIPSRSSTTATDKYYGTNNPQYVITRRTIRKISDSLSQQVDLGGQNEPSEDEIAEAIFDWWISGKGYEKWFAEKYLQQKIEFE